MDRAFDPDLLVDDPEPLLGATLYLMSAYRQRRCPVAAHKIAENLERLATHPYCSAHLRRLCASMRDQWRAECGPATVASEAPAADGPARTAGQRGTLH